MQQISKKQIVMQEGVKELKDNYKIKTQSMHYHLPKKLSNYITTAQNIESIISLYPQPLRTLHTVFRLDINGENSPFFLHSQVAFALIQISQGEGDSLRKFIEFYQQEDFLPSMVVVDDGEIIDLQIVFTLWIAHICQVAHKDDTKIPDMAFEFPIIWDDEIDMSRLGEFSNLIELKTTNYSKNYIIDQSAIVKKHQIDEDYEKSFIINQIYENQIKRVIQYFYQNNRSSIAEGFQSLDLFVISASDPTMILDYASISEMNITLDKMSDPNQSEYWIIIILDYLAFLHRCMNLVNLDIKPRNIFLSKYRSDQYLYQNSNRGSQIIQMGLNSSIVIDLEGDSQYYVRIANEYFCSPIYWQAFKNQTPLSAQDLIQEDHYQLVKTLDEVCQGRKDLTDETMLMLEILQSTNTIEHAIYKIYRKLELIHKVFSEIRNQKLEVGDFAIGFLRNLDPIGLGNKSLPSIELLLQCEPYDLAKKLLEYTISFLYPKFLFEDQGQEFRQRFLALSIINNLNWLSPLLVIIDCLEFYQDETEEEMSKQLTLIEESISQLAVTDQIKTYLAICHGFKVFWSRCQEHSEANWVQFSKHLMKAARQLTGYSEEEKKRLKEFDLELDEYGNNKAPSVIPGFKKESLQPFAFIARHNQPKGLFQVLKKGKTRYFMSLTSQLIKVFRENQKQQLIELPSYDYKVESCHDGSMCVVDRDGMRQVIKKIDKFLEIDINQKLLQAKDSKQACIIQMTRESAFQKVVRIKIGAWQTA